LLKISEIESKNITRDKIFSNLRVCAKIHILFFFPHFISWFSRRGRFVEKPIGRVTSAIYIALFIRVYAFFFFFFPNQKPGKIS